MNRIKSLSVRGRTHVNQASSFFFHSPETHDCGKRKLHLWKWLEPNKSLPPPLQPPLSFLAPSPFMHDAAVISRDDVSSEY